MSIPPPSTATDELDLGLPSDSPASGAQPAKRERAKRVPSLDGTAVRDNPHVPSAWLVQPIFRLHATGKPATSHLVADGRTWHFSVPNPLTREPSRELTLYHGAVLFSVLGIFEEQLQIATGSPELSAAFASGEAIPCSSISLTDLSRRVSGYKDDNKVRLMKVVLDDLRHTYFSVEEEVDRIDKSTKKPVLGPDGKPQKRKQITTFSLLHGLAVRDIMPLQDGEHLDPEEVGRETIDHEPVIKATWLDSVTLHPQLLRLCRELGRIVKFRLAVWREISSPIAQACYLYLPSRAIHSTAQRPWRISLTKLLNQLGHPDPGSMKMRRKLFIQNGEKTKDSEIDGRLSRSIVAQLDRKPMSFGTLRCRLEPNASETDYLLIVWKHEEGSRVAENDTEPSKLLAAWRESRRSEQEYRLRIASPAAINEAEAELFEEALIDTSTSTTFFRMAKTLLGDHAFISLLAEARQEIIGANGPGPENPTGLLISRMLLAIAKGPAPKSAIVPTPELHAPTDAPRASSKGAAGQGTGAASRRARIEAAIAALPDDRRRSVLDQMARIEGFTSIPETEADLRIYAGRLRSYDVELD